MIEPTSDALCHGPGTTLPAPAGKQRVVAPSRVQSTSLPNRQDTSSSARFRRIPIPCPEHLPSCPEPSPLARRLLRGLRPRCSLEAATHIPVSPYRYSESAFSTLRRFLPARHSLSSYPRGHALEWRLGYFQPTSATHYLSSQTAPVLTSLESDFGFAPGPFEVPAGSRRRARFGGTARSFDRLFAHRLRGDLRL